MSEKQFYSKSELEEFRQLVNEKLEKARSEYKRLANNLKEIGQNTSDSFNITEYGNESVEKEEVELLMARQAKFIYNLEKAMMRVENGTYGKCRISGALIPKERLRVVPHATTTIEAKKQQTLKRTPTNKG
ncbi:MAG: TraR/DksA family transcriptional regulator [Bacteroidia bacterium]|nr:TraR/DksA family transcriptional regulator [Bacteroidia bacterium]